MGVYGSEITVTELLSRYAAGERDFTNVAIDDWSEGLFRGIDLSGINLEGSFIGVDFSGTIMRGANLRYTVWDIVVWEDIDFSGSDFTGIDNGDGSVFVRCNLSNTIWDRASLFQFAFENCNQTGANFENATLAEVDFYNR